MPRIIVLKGLEKVHYWGSSKNDCYDVKLCTQKESSGLLTHCRFLVFPSVVSLLVLNVFLRIVQLIWDMHEKGKHGKRMFTCSRHSETLLSRFERFHLSMKGGKLFEIPENTQLLMHEKEVICWLFKKQFKSWNGRKVNLEGWGLKTFDCLSLGVGSFQKILWMVDKPSFWFTLHNKTHSPTPSYSISSRIFKSTLNNFNQKRP
jgi:hypothetical protein